MSEITVALAQISPIWLDKNATLKKISDYIVQAAEQAADLVVFGEGLLPGYPFWVELTEGARFESDKQKDMFAHYVSNAISIEQNELQPLQDLCKKHKVACYLGCIETTQRRGHSLYCSLVYIDQQGFIKSVHRKLMPTYEERLVWSPGDGNGLRTHALNDFRLGGLNCWENWIPMARQSLYAQGENLHIAVWPGNPHNTADITRFIAKESRSFVVSVCGLCSAEDIPKSIPVRDEMIANSSGNFATGGSAVAGPDGEWILEPVLDRESLSLVTLELSAVLKERQNFDPAGHYSRPDVLSLQVNRDRQSTTQFKD